MKAKPWDQISEEDIFTTKIFSVKKSRSRSPHTKKEHDFVRLQCPDWINVICLTQDSNIVLIKQYRHGTKEITTEIPGGMVDSEESSLDAAKRELAEETGYVAENWEEIGMVEPNPAFQANKTYTFLATGAKKEQEPNLDENEEIEVFEIPFDELFGLVTDGTIKHSLVICAFFHLINKGYVQPVDQP